MSSSLTSSRSTQYTIPLLKFFVRCADTEMGTEVRRLPWSSLMENVNSVAVKALLVSPSLSIPPRSRRPSTYHILVPFLNDHNPPFVGTATGMTVSSVHWRGLRFWGWALQAARQLFGTSLGERPKPGGVGAGERPEPGGVGAGERPKPEGVGGWERPRPGVVGAGDRPKPGGVGVGERPRPRSVFAGQYPC